MALDTQYRPRTYSDVLGQRESVQILKQYVASGAGFHQSYLFAGPFGSGKTTLARVLARALLCVAPVEGEPCDQCVSCRSLLEGGSSPDFFEIDAATNSGKDSVRRIVDEVQYSTFSGKRRLYLLDESHQLTKDALDALLKPLEDTIPGSQDKSLVCIFCTTEPERMRNTILSRCAPAFVIRPVAPEQVGERLAMVCEREGIPYERPALNLIGEITECHIRDALKAVEGVSMLGKVNVTNVTRYLHLDYSGTVLEILANVKKDIVTSLARATELMTTMSPITAYEKLADMALLAYRASLGPVAVPTYLNKDSVEELGRSVGPELLDFAEKLSSRPGRPSASMLLCDLSQLHRGVRVVVAEAPKLSTTTPPAPKDGGSVPTQDKPSTTDGVYVHPRAVNANPHAGAPAPAPAPSPFSSSYSPLEFFQLVRRRVVELGQGQDGIGQSGRNDVGDAGAHQTG